MALDPQIASIKAAGTYRFEFDKSQIVSIPANQTRLLAGFSKKGPFNTPVFIPDTAFFKQVFGDIDRNLERKDSYFHRSCLAALERGPILALNLLSLDSNDRVEFIKLGTSATPDTQNNINADREYQKFYNRDKFFFPDPNAFLDNVGANRTTLSSLSTNDLLDFVNLGQNPVSIIVKKAADTNVSAFNVTVEEWYGSANIPGFLNKDSLISDFMVDVFVINGNFGGDFTSANPYERFEADPIFQPYFDKTRGIKRKRFASDTNDTLIQEFFNESEVDQIATYTVSLLPDFVDLLGRNLFIENVINRDTATTGLLCAVNQDLFSGDFLIDGVPGGIDLIGHNIEYSQVAGTQNDINFLSYHAPIVADLSEQRTSQPINRVTLLPGNTVDTITETFVVKSIPNPDTGATGEVYEINEEDRPVLNLIRGGVYTFDVSDLSNTPHPLRFRLDDGTTDFTAGVTAIGTQGEPNATVVFTVPLDAPDDLRYYCTVHGNGMGNVINVANTITETFIVKSVDNPNQDQGGKVYEITFDDGTIEIKPQLNLIRGGVYTFDQSDASNAGGGGHPLRFRVGGLNSTQFTEGVVATGTPGQQGAKTVFTVPLNAPSTLQYYCTNHPLYMGNVITIPAAQSENINVSLVTGGSIQITVIGGSGDELYDAFASMTPNTTSTVGSFIKGAVSEKFVPVLSVNVTSSVVTLLLSSAGEITTDDFPIDAFTVYEYVNEDDINFTSQEFEAAFTNSNIISSYGSNLFMQVANGVLTDGDKAVYRIAGENYLSFLVFNTVDYGFIHTGSPTTAVNKIAISDSTYNLPVVRINAYEEDQFINLTPKSQFNIDGTGAFLSSDGVPYILGRLGVQTLKGSINSMIDIVADATTEPLLKSNQILISSNSQAASSIIVGNYLLNSEGSSQTPHSRLTKINQVQGGKTNAQFPAIPLGATALLITCQSEVAVTTVDTVSKVELYFPIDSWVEYLNIFTLNGFKLDVNKHVPNGSNERQNQILNGTLNGTNLFKALTDRETINFRYLVDTFGNGVEAGSKSVYTRLCSTRKNAFAIINAPSAKDFKLSTDPLFVDATGALSSRNISTGGDLSRNPTVRYSLPAANQGASFGAFYYPFLTVRDLGKNIIVPPAAYISNNFIAKFENALPWSLVAGVRRGVVGGTGVVGLEINLDNEDRDFLEPFGLNPIIFQSGTGPTIFANKTAQQTPRSALSSINVRECVIFIQDGIDAILKNYLFEFNTPQTRLEIKTLADNFLSTVQNDDGIFDFRNVMDETNNTPDVIDNNIGVLDTFIEPVRGMEILVQRTTILRTGAISTGNFQ